MLIKPNQISVYYFKALNFKVICYMAKAPLVDHIFQNGKIALEEKEKEELKREVGVCGKLLKAVFPPASIT